MKNLFFLALLTGTFVAAQTPSSVSPAFKTPDGFQVNLFAGGLKQPRFMALSSVGDVFVSDPGKGTVEVLKDRNADGKADGRTTFASGLNKPHGLAFHGGYLYVANTDGVVRFLYKAGDQKASGPAQKIVDLPGNGGHWTRTVTFGPDNKMYVAVGSSCNVCEEKDARRAAIWVYDADGKNGKAYATGLRNAVGQVWVGNQMYATSNGRDMLGEDVPPEGFYQVAAGKFYGWPYCYTVEAGQAQVWDKDFKGKAAAVCKDATPAFALTTAHAAPLGITAYTGQTFPAAYRSRLFAALHGSWNRSQKSGYKVVMIEPSSGKVSDFISGFLKGQSVLGRPVDLLTAPDGSLLLTDDYGGNIWRIQYTK